MEIKQLKLGQRVDDLDLNPNRELGTIVSLNPVKVRFGSWVVSYTNEQAEKDLQLVCDHDFQICFGSGFVCVKCGEQS